MLAGHDYDRVNWPLTYHNVNVFANRKVSCVCMCATRKVWMFAMYTQGPCRGR